MNAGAIWGLKSADLKGRALHGSWALVRPAKEGTLLDSWSEETHEELAVKKPKTETEKGSVDVSGVLIGIVQTPPI